MLELLVSVSDWAFFVDQSPLVRAHGCAPRSRAAWASPGPEARLRMQSAWLFASGPKQGQSLPRLSLHQLSVPAIYWFLICAEQVKGESSPLPEAWDLLISMSCIYTGVEVCRSLRQKSYKLTVRVLLRICEKMYVILNLKRYHCLCTAVQKSNQRTAELQRHSNSKMCRHTAGPSRRALMRRGAEVSRGCVISHPALGWCHPKHCFRNRQPAAFPRIFIRTDVYVGRGFHGIIKALHFKNKTK